MNISTVLIILAAFAAAYIGWTFPLKYTIAIGLTWLLASLIGYLLGKGL